MSPKRISRRTALSAGSAVVGLGVVGASVVELASHDDETPGADGFTAGTVPTGSDPLVVVDADVTMRNDVATTVLGTLLDAQQFGDLPDALVGVFESGSRPTVDADSVGKLAFVGSGANADAGGAVVWADWTDDELLAVLESADGGKPGTETYRDRTVHATAETAAARLGDREFALGTSEVVRNVVDRWHGDADPVGGETLRSFERTPHNAPVRFSFDRLGVACDGDRRSGSAAYDRVTQVYGSVPADGDAVRLHLRAESKGDSGEVATALRRDLGVTGEGSAGGGNAGLPHEAVEGITVESDTDFVAVESDTARGDAFVSAVVETVACLTGRAEP